MPDQNEPRVWNAGDPEPNLGVEALVDANGQQIDHFGLGWANRHHVKVDWSEVNRLGVVWPLTEVQKSSPVSSPAEDGNASEKGGQPGGTVPALDALEAAVRGVTVALAEVGKHLWPASERLNAGAVQEIDWMAVAEQRKDSAEYHQIRTGEERARAEFAEAKLDEVRDFCAERAEYVTALRQSTTADADYYRWQGGAEARRQLSERLGLPVAWPAEMTETVRVIIKEAEHE